MKSKKPQAVFIVGFNNWGKTSIIRRLFNKQAFTSGKDYPINDHQPQINFAVQPSSNDDITNAQSWIDDVNKRIGNKTTANLLAALCPTYSAIQTDVLRNNFIDILKHKTFNRYEYLHLFLIEYKYDHHAKLMINEIKKACKQIDRIKIVVIDADAKIHNEDTADQNIYDERLDAQVKQIKKELNNIF